MSHHAVTILAEPAHIDEQLKERLKSRGKSELPPDCPKYILSFPPRSHKVKQDGVKF